MSHELKYLSDLESSEFAVKILEYNLILFFCVGGNRGVHRNKSVLDKVDVNPK